MHRPISGRAIRHHDDLLDRAWRLCEPLIYGEGDVEREAPTFLEGARLRQAIRLFGAALELEPEHSQTHWGLGKAYQRLGRRHEALLCFERAVDCVPAHDPLAADACREASIAALEAGAFDAAAIHCAAALGYRPDDAGLVANHALALALCGDHAGAEARIRRACALDPADPVSRNVALGIDAIRRGDVPAPATMREFQHAMRVGICAERRSPVRLAEMVVTTDDDAVARRLRSLEELRDYVCALRARVADLFATGPCAVHAGDGFECLLHIELRPGGEVEREIVAPAHALSNQAIDALDGAVDTVSPAAVDEGPVRFELRFEFVPTA